ncbi:DUF3325 family protein [Flagellimonas sp. S174]|uniref:DUF3325 family protein n=1 Tax=Flagellimonas sp. S174 TaxID=3410790 RepID=UPI003BF4F11B
MGILLTFFGCFFLYSKSKHFPVQFSEIAAKTQGREKQLRIGAYGLFILANTILVYQFGWATGLIIFFMVLMFGLSVIIILLPLHKKFAYLLIGLSLLSILIENIL